MSPWPTIVMVLLKLAMHECTEVSSNALLQKFNQEVVELVLLSRIVIPSDYKTQGLGCINLCLKFSNIHIASILCSVASSIFEKRPKDHWKLCWILHISTDKVVSVSPSEEPTWGEIYIVGWVNSLDLILVSPIRYGKDRIVISWHISSSRIEPNCQSNRSMCLNESKWHLKDFFNLYVLKWPKLHNTIWHESGSWVSDGGEELNIVCSYEKSFRWSDRL